MDGDKPEATLKPCESCNAKVPELRRGRCWGCYLRWTDARPVGMGACCSICSERRRDHLRSMELLGRWVPMCHVCATRTARLEPIPRSVDEIRRRLTRERRVVVTDRRAHKAGEGEVMERRTGERRSRRTGMWTLSREAEAFLDPIGDVAPNRSSGRRGQESDRTEANSKSENHRLQLPEFAGMLEGAALFDLSLSGPNAFESAGIDSQSDDYSLDPKEATQIRDLAEFPLFDDGHAIHPRAVRRDALERNAAELDDGPSIIVSDDLIELDENDQEELLFRPPPETSDAPANSDQPSST